MPLALDLTSTLARGWILPVATTDRATSPFSIEAIFEGSMVLFGFSAARTANPAPVSTVRSTAAQISLFFLLPFLPFLPLVAIGFYLSLKLLRRKRTAFVPGNHTAAPEFERYYRVSAATGGLL